MNKFWSHVIATAIGLIAGGLFIWNIMRHGPVDTAEIAKLKAETEQAKKHVAEAEALAAALKSKVDSIEKNRPQPSKISSDAKRYIQSLPTDSALDVMQQRFLQSPE